MYLLFLVKRGNSVLPGFFIMSIIRFHYVPHNSQAYVDIIKVKKIGKKKIVFHCDTQLSHNMRNNHGSQITHALKLAIILYSCFQTFFQNKKLQLIYGFST